MLPDMLPLVLCQILLVHFTDVGRRGETRVSGAQRDFLLAELWKEQEIPRWRCERKTLFSEEVAGAEARADTESERHHRVCLTLESGHDHLARRWTAAFSRGVWSWAFYFWRLPVAGSGRAGSILKQDTNMLNQRHADQLALRDVCSVRHGNQVCVVTQPGFDREPLGCGSQVLGLHPPLL